MEAAACTLWRSFALTSQTQSSQSLHTRVAFHRRLRMRPRLRCQLNLLGLCGSCKLDLVNNYANYFQSQGATAVTPTAEQLRWSLRSFPPAATIRSFNSSAMQHQWFFSNAVVIQNYAMVQVVSSTFRMY
eukprot:1064-Heterococcus_DN1.PRE.1